MRFGIALLIIGIVIAILVSHAIGVACIVIGLAIMAWAYFLGGERI